MQERFIRESECKAISGLSRTTRWRLERENLFPKRRQIGKSSVGWLKSEIEEWVFSRQFKTVWPNEAEHESRKRQGEL